MCVIGAEQDLLNKIQDKCEEECDEYAHNSTIFAETVVTEWDLICGKAFKNRYIYYYVEVSP